MESVCLSFFTHIIVGIKYASACLYMTIDIRMHIETNSGFHIKNAINTENGPSSRNSCLIFNGIGAELGSG